nr:Rieske 2Fe-2S domain-containing protein [uncultured Gellertiella sp.]
MFPDSRCAWTPVALSRDLPPATVVPAFIPEGSFALWRSQSGRLSVSADRCPHRGMRLSHGFVRGEALSCIYHGWSYGQSGQCLRIPAHPDLTPPEAIRVVTATACEQDGVIWVAARDPQMTPPALDGMEPLRTLTSTARQADLLRALGQTEPADGMVRTRLADTDTTLLFAPQASDQILIHVLVDATAGLAARIAVSRALEAVRRAAEQVHQKDAAA